MRGQNRNPRRARRRGGGAALVRGPRSAAATTPPPRPSERRSPGRPTVEFISPRNGAVQRGTAVVVKAEIENFRLAPRHFGGEPLLGEGSIRFSLNRVPDCVDPVKLQNADRKPDRQRPAGRRLLRLSRMGGPQRRARRPDRLDAAATRPRPGRRSSTAACAPASTASSSPSPATTARRRPYHDVTSFQILEKPNHEIADLRRRQGLERRGRRRRPLRSTRSPRSGPILHFV